MIYLLLKWVHILSATLLFGTGLGSAFYMFMANRRRELDGICFATRHVVLADWLFTTPAAIIQPLTGFALMHVQGYSFHHAWLAWALALYCLAGACWIPVVILQIKMRDMAHASQANQTALPAAYWQMNRWWIILGAIAFPAILVIFYLMVFKPTVL